VSINVVFRSWAAKHAENSWQLIIPPVLMRSGIPPRARPVRRAIIATRQKIAAIRLQYPDATAEPEAIRSPERRTSFQS